MALLNSVAISTSPNTVSFGSVSGNLNEGTYTANDAASGVTNVITSTGVVYAPITGDRIPRTVQVTAQRQALFSKGVVSMTDITINGKSSDPVVSDSYDSRYGPYNSSTSGTNGDVAAVNGIVDLGNHIIDGNLYLGPNSTYTSAGNQVTGTIYQDWNMVFPDVSLPTPVDASGNPIAWTPAPGNSGSHTFSSGGYYIIGDNGDLNVPAGTTVVLDVQSSSYDLSKASINIGGGMTNAGTIIMYQERGTVTLGGSNSGGAVNNQPKNFVYFGLPGVTSISMGGGSTFVGVIYAPEASMTLNGGGSDNNFMGAFIVKKLTVNGHYNFHFDTSLLGYYYGYYVIGSWQEL
jgi:hypothetical protein